MNAPVVVPTHLSASSLGTFLRCPRQYRLKYIDGVTPAFRASALAFGSAFHEAAAQWLTAQALGHNLPGGVLHELFADSLRHQVRADGPPILWRDDNDSAESLRTMGVAMLDVLMERLPKPDRVLGVEVPFELDLADPVFGTPLPPVVGAVDAIIEVEAETLVLELKTAARRWGEDDLQHNLQATTYHVAMAEQLDAPAVLLAVVTKTKRPAVQLERLVRGPSNEADLVATVASVSRAVKAGVDHPVRSWMCKSCPFQGACR